jgi:hypothetical protein
MLKIFYRKLSYFFLLLFTLLGLFHTSLWAFFKTNIFLNSTISIIFLSGVLLIIKKTRTLNEEIQWAIGRREGKLRLNSLYFPDILAVLAVIFPESTKTLPSSSTPLILETIQGRIENNHRVIRYLTSVLILMGLLGTFWGLLQTIQAISHVIGSLPSNQMENTLSFFDSLKTGLQLPLTGMGTAFSSSMFGLGASLCLGFLDLQLSQLYQDFYKDIEEWMISLNSSVLSIGNEPSEAYLAGTLEKFTHQLNESRMMMDKQTDIQQQFLKSTLILNEKLSLLGDVIKTEQSLMLKIAEHQIDLQALLKHFHTELTGPMRNNDEIIQTYLRNIESSLTQISVSFTHDQLKALQEITLEMRLLSKIITSSAV